MNRRCILSISAMTVFGLASVPGSAVGQEKSLKDQIVGTWILVSTETTSQSGKRYPYGTDPRGILILDAIGRYAVVQGRVDRPKLKSAVRRVVTKKGNLGLRHWISPPTLAPGQSPWTRPLRVELRALSTRTSRELLRKLR